MKNPDLKVLSFIRQMEDDDLLGSQGFRQPAVLAVLITASLEYTRPEKNEKKCKQIRFLGFSEVF